MNSNTFYVIELINEAGKSISYARKISNCCNLVGAFKPIEGFRVLSVNACDTWREAQEIARAWNDNAIKYGRYAF